MWIWHEMCNLKFIINYGEDRMIWEELIEVSKHAIVITVFVFGMMVVIEYVNVLSSGQWQNRLVKSQWGQYLLGAALGATPGCLGAFVVVSLYSHRVVSLGAVVATMVATSGDEAFVMLAMMPVEALKLTAILFVVGVFSGVLSDRLFFRNAENAGHEGFEIHEHDDCRCFPRGQIREQLERISSARGSLILGLSLTMLALAIGELGPSVWNWKRLTLLAVVSVGLFIVATVPEHFLQEHLFEHVVKKHLPAIFLWTFGALVAIDLIVDHLQLGDVIARNAWSILGISAVIGIIPSSGPHLLFVTMFKDGLIPFAVLLASSIAQDGHGMLPLLGHSRRDFVLVKLVNVVIALLIGGGVLLLTQ